VSRHVEIETAHARAVSSPAACTLWDEWLLLWDVAKISGLEKSTFSRSDL
jgi:hypothetical protein